MPPRPHSLIDASYSIPSIYQDARTTAGDFLELRIAAVDLDYLFYGVKERIEEWFGRGHRRSLLKPQRLFIKYSKQNLHLLQHAFNPET